VRGVAFALIGAAVAAAALDEAAVGGSRRRLEVLAKPAVMVLLMGAAAALHGTPATTRWALTLGALGCSLAGDLLLLPAVDRFVPGLVAFLTAHLLYIAAFDPSWPPVLPTLPVAVAVGIVGVALARPLERGLRARDPRLLGPVRVYVVVISAMVVAAAATLGRAEWPTGAAVAATAGAVLFYVSDASLGWSRFVHDVPGGRVTTMATYHGAQVLLVLALLAFGPRAT
jgi:alkenylglycerophosphocholine/alkenylglycerophosphoethanolamine hydrolase